MLIIYVLLAAILFFVFGVSVSGWFASSGFLRASDVSYMAGLRVLGATEDTVTLPRKGMTARRGIYGIAWQKEYAVLGEVVASDRRTVTRRIIRATRPPLAGLAVCWNTFVYLGDPERAHALAYQDVQVPSQVGALPAWFLPGTRSTWLLLFHGYHGTREEGLRILPTLVNMGFPVLMMCYRNDACAPRSSDGFYHFGDTEWQDIEAGVRYALEHGAQDVALYGWSMGGCMIEAFLRRSSYAAWARAVVLDSPVLNWDKAIEAQIRHLHVPYWFIYVIKWFALRRAGLDFACIRHDCLLPERTTPTLLFHSAADPMVPIESSDIFAESRPDVVTYQRVFEADHAQVWNSDPRTYEEALETFLTRVIVPESFMMGREE